MVHEIELTTTKGQSAGGQAESCIISFFKGVMSLLSQL